MQQWIWRIRTGLFVAAMAAVALIGIGWWSDWPRQWIEIAAVGGFVAIVGAVAITALLDREAP